MKQVYNFARNPNLTVSFLNLPSHFFKGKSVSHEKVVALYSYEASTPEDLDFKEGNVITVLSKGRNKIFSSPILA